MLFGQSIIGGEIATFVSFSWVLPTAGVVSRWQNSFAILNLAFSVTFRQFYICLLKHAGQRRFQPKQIACQRDQTNHPQNVFWLM